MTELEDSIAANIAEWTQTNVEHTDPNARALGITNGFSGASSRSRKRKSGRSPT